MLRKALYLTTGFCACFALTSMASGAAKPATISPAATSAADKRVPLYFEENHGQTAPEVRFLARGGGYTAFLSDHEAVLLYRNGREGQKDTREAVVRMKLAGSMDSSAMAGAQRLPGVVNYLTGNDPAKWHTRIPTYAEIEAHQVYRGIDLAYRPNGKELEYDFRLAPGADANQIRMTYSGTRGMHVNAAGDLVFDTNAGRASILKPIAYQDIDGKRVHVAAAYALMKDGTVGFHLGKYDHERALVIDPTVGPSVYYSTYLGSGTYTSYGDTFKSIAVDAAGEAFVTGQTTEAAYPLSGSAYQSTIPANYVPNTAEVGFVTALNASGTGIIYSTFISGNSADASTGVNLNGIAVNAAGNAFATGTTDDPTFPTYKAFQTTFPGSRSGYVVNVGVVFELSPSGDSLVYSSLIGGGDYDVAYGIAVDSSSNAYITGTTSVQGSVNTTSGFPVTGGAIWGHFQQQNIGAGFTDGFAAKIAPPSSGNATLAYSTVIGSANSITPFVYASAIAVDSSGDAYVTGRTNCDISDHGGTIAKNLNMSAVTRAQSEYVNNVWVLELNPTASQAVYIAYLGGSVPSGQFSPDTAVSGIAVDGSGQAYIAGDTEATNFQTTAGAYQTTPKLAGVTNGSSIEQHDGFITIIGANGANFAYSTYLNGSNVTAAADTGGVYGTPAIAGIALGTGGQFAVAGVTGTSDFPTGGSPQGIPLMSTFPTCFDSGGGGAAFLTKFTTSGLVYTTFLGTSCEYSVTGIASNGTDMYVMMPEQAGNLYSGGAFDLDNSSAAKTMIVRVSDAPAVSTTMTVDDKTASFSSSAQTLTLTSSVSAASTVQGGTVTYVVKDSSSVQVGTPVTSGIVAGGVAPSVSYTLPANTANGNYTINASYRGAQSFLGSTAMGTLVVGNPLQAQATLLVTGVPGTAQAYTSSFTVGSSGGSGTGAVTYNATGSCSIAGTTVTITSGSGTCSVTATKAADSTYQSTTSTASTVSATTAAQATLSVTGVPGTAQGYNTTFTVSTSGGSGTGTVTYNATGSCSISGTTVTINSGSGTCSVTATKATDGNYASTTSAASTVSATQATQTTLTVTGVPGTAQAYNSSFTVSSSGGSGTGAVTFNATGPCSISGTTVTMTGGTGTCSVTATKAADSNYASATSAASTVSATQAAQAALTLTGVPGTAQAYNTTFTVSSSGGSGTGAVTFGATGSCSVSGSTVTMTSGTGTCSVTATKAADSNYASATSSASTVSATVAAQAALTLTGAPATEGYNASFTVGTSGGSGTGAVTFSATGPCSISGTTVTMTGGTGTCSMTASKAADGNYASATSAAANVNATVGTQATLTVTGVPGTDQTYNSSFTVNSTGGSGTGVVTFAATGSCSIAGTTVTMTSGSGTCSVTATKAADSNYNSATSVPSSVNAALTTQGTLTVVGIPGTAQAYNTSFAVSSTGGSGSGAVTFGTTGACSVSGSTVTMTSGTGSCAVTATKAADSNYASATSSPVAVSAALGTQAALTLTGVPATAGYDSSFTVGTSGGSGTGAVTFSAAGPCSMSGSSVTITSGSGTCAITASKAADGNYASATSVPASANATVGTQAALTVLGVPGIAQAYGTSFTVSSAGGSGTGAVTFNATGSCSIAGTAVTIMSGSGLCAVTATKAADNNYTSATSAPASVSAALAAQAPLTVTGVLATPQAYNNTFAIGSAGGSGTGAVTFVAAGSCSISGMTVTMASGTGPCSVSAIKAGDADYAEATSAASIVNAVRSTQTVFSLNSNGNNSLFQNPVTFTAQVISPIGTPTGTVTFLDGSKVLGTGTLTGGVATLTTSTLALGGHTITAMYSGDSNFSSASSGKLTQIVTDFGVGTSGGSGSTGGTGTGSSGSGSGSTGTSGSDSGSQTVSPGGTANYAINITSTAGTTLPNDTVLTVTGTPAGTVIKLAPSTWKQLSSNSWQLPANTPLSNVTVTLTVPAQTAHSDAADGLGRIAAPTVLGMLLLPFAVRFRRAGKRMSRMLSVLLLLAIGAAAAVGLSGCASSNGFFAQSQKVYPVTVNVTSGNLSHSTNITLTIQ